MRHFFIACAVLLGVAATAPAYAQSATTTTKQNSAEAGGSIGAVGPSTPTAQPRSGTAVIQNSNPNAPHTGVSDEAAAAGGAR